MSKRINMIKSVFENSENLGNRIIGKILHFLGERLKDILFFIGAAVVAILAFFIGGFFMKAKNDKAILEENGIRGDV